MVGLSIEQIGIERGLEETLEAEMVYIYIYLELVKKLEFIFDCPNYSEDKNAKLAVIEFIDYMIIWWD